MGHDTEMRFPRSSTAGRAFFGVEVDRRETTLRILSFAPTAERREDLLCGVTSGIVGSLGGAVAAFVGVVVVGKVAAATLVDGTVAGGASAAALSLSVVDGGGGSFALGATATSVVSGTSGAGGGAVVAGVSTGDVTGVSSQVDSTIVEMYKPANETDDGTGYRAGGGS